MRSFDPTDGRETMRIEYTCADGSRTLALWPSLALLYWLGRSYPRPVIANPEPFKLYVVRSPVPADEHEWFLTLVYAEIGGGGRADHVQFERLRVRDDGAGVGPAQP